MALVVWVNKLAAGGAIVLQIFVAATAAYLIFVRRPGNRFFGFCRERVLTLALILASAGVLGSLFYSEFAGFEPCVLCWYQRIFLYPQVVILALALWKKDRAALFYLAWLTVLGALIALYHNYIYYGGRTLFSCDVTYGKVCDKVFVLEFGYITIPFMSLIVFLSLLSLYLLALTRSGKGATMDLV